MNTEQNIVYVRLLEEGTEVFRPTNAVYISNEAFKLLPCEGYDPEDEKWEFLPGSIVRCEKRVLEGKEIMLAVKKIIMS